MSAIHTPIFFLLQGWQHPPILAVHTFPSSNGAHSQHGNVSKKRPMPHGGFSEQREGGKKMSNHSFLVDGG